MVMAMIPRSVVTLSLISTLLLVVSPLCTAKYILYSGETLRSGETLSWESYVFAMGNDCDLVLYDIHGSIVRRLWASNTTGAGVPGKCYAKLHIDGNLVIYNYLNKPVWASNTNVGDGHYILILQKDGNVVIYGGAIWATNTAQSAGAISVTSKASTMEGFLAANGSNAAAARNIAMVGNN